ncbi:MAG: FadR family transcriptional regulator [Desulfobacteraceae bacterium]|nr:FadR family transcriptional regulator [Desulfobacteraceae bacterium]
MQESLLKQVELTVQRLGLKAGDRLPAERQLSKELTVSRNSLRRLLHILEGRGLVDIRKGSGTFLKTRFFNTAYPYRGMDSTSPEKIVADQLETAFLFFPVMVELAGHRMNTAQLEKLQNSNVSLSRSIFSKDPQKVWMESLSFFRLIAFGTGNSFMVNIMEEICSIDMAPFDHFFEVTQKSREQLFGDHVNILNALREKKCKKAKLVTREYVRHLSQILEIRDGILPDTLLAYYKDEM